MHVAIKRVDATLPLPEYKTAGAVAFDFSARETTVIKSHEVGRIPGNLIIKVPHGFMLYVKDRSSTAKKGLLITAGIIDEDYCGEGDEILLQFYNYTNSDVTVLRGERVAQGIFVAVARAEWREQETMDAPARGGFGTTGSF